MMPAPRPEGSLSDRDKQRYDFLKTQLQQAVDTYRMQYTLLIQGVTALITANVAILGYGINKESSLICLIACVFPLQLHILNNETTKGMLPAIYTAVRIEQELADSPAQIAPSPQADTWATQELRDGLVSTFIGTRLTAEYLRELRQVCAVPEFAERTALLHDFLPPHLKRSRTYATRYTLNAAIFQAATAAFYWGQSRQFDPLWLQVVLDAYGFAAVIGLCLLLRHLRREHRRHETRLALEAKTHLAVTAAKQQAL